MRVPRLKIPNSAIREALLSESDIPTGVWNIKDTRTWRMGSFGDASAQAIAAGNNGLHSAWRSFKEKDDENWIWCQVFPFLSVEDASSAYPPLRSRLVPNRGFSKQQELISERESTDYIELDGEVCWGIEWHTQSTTEEAWNVVIGRRVSSCIVMVSVSARNAEPTREFLSSLTLKLSQRTVAYLTLNAR